MATLPMMAPIIAGVWELSAFFVGGGVAADAKEGAGEDVDGEDVEEKEDRVDEGLGVAIGSTSALDETKLGSKQLSTL